MLCDLGNLNQTLCVQCAQRLVNFNKIREKSLRARSLLLGLVEKHELLTIRHIKSINRVKHKLKSDITKTFLGPGQFNVYIAHSDTDTQTQLDATAESVAMEQDKSHSMSVDAVQSLPTAVTSADSCNASFAFKEEYLSDDSNPSEAKQIGDPPIITSSLCETTAVTMAPVKLEVTFACTTCLEEFADEDMYFHHTLMHTEDIGNPKEDSVAVCSPSSVAAVASTLKTDQENTEHPTAGKAEVETIVPLPTGLVKKHENEVHPSDNNDELDISVLENNKPQITILQPDTSLAKLCDYKCTVRGNLMKHTRTHTGDKRHACKICNYQFKRIDHLVSHMRTHTGEKPFVCKLCDYKCRDKSNLLKHMRTHTGEKPYACQLCDYKCGHSGSLVNHMRTHTGEKPYACQLCDYKCGYSGSLVNHMRTHTGEKLYPCELCDYKFGVRRDLVRHMRTHTGEKPYFCELCDYKCTAKKNLVLHMRNHTGEKPYACELCDYKCTEKRSLVQHMRRHTGEKPYACELCDYKCTQKRSLVQHMRKHCSLNI